ncbi:hypothetical protein O1L68_22410 [Streptomyces lydicus]|nr:hypothetical protein [Streptomyces lydicus]
MARAARSPTPHPDTPRTPPHRLLFVWLHGVPALPAAVRRAYRFRRTAPAAPSPPRRAPRPTRPPPPRSAPPRAAPCAPPSAWYPWPSSAAGWGWS